MYICINDLAAAIRYCGKKMYFDRETYEISPDPGRECLAEPYRFTEIPTINYEYIRRDFLAANNLLNRHRIDEYAKDPHKFHIFINDKGIYWYNAYIDHEFEQIKKLAAQWCAENGINYTYKEGKANEGN